MGDFTGDTLFADDVGRVDLLGLDMMDKMAGLLYESIFDKLLKFNDGVIIYPAHGPGSVCGSDTSGRLFTTIGLERLYNPKLQYKDKNEFADKVSKELERPPYFRRMEKLNVEGAPILGWVQVPSGGGQMIFMLSVQGQNTEDDRAWFDECQAVKYNE